jgi:hypothetical protein
MYMTLLTLLVFHGNYAKFEESPNMGGLADDNRGQNDSDRITNVLSASPHIEALFFV